MALSQHAPRVNNNDDEVQVVQLNVSEGDLVKRGQTIAAVETDKAVVEVEAEREGYVLKILPRLGDRVAVGSVLLWLGDTVDERVPESPILPPSQSRGTVDRPTAKATAMLRDLGLSADQIPASGSRLTAADVEAYLAGGGKTPRPAQVSVKSQGGDWRPEVPGEYEELSPQAHGMLSTVLWHRDQAAAAYLEIEYDPKPWEEFAAEYARSNGLMLSPLLPLLAYRLVELAKENPKINATISNGRRYRYATVNLGFTVQAGETLYLAVVRDAQAMDASHFIGALGEVQRHAMAHKLRPDESVGATLAFSSMARWNISRHIPILPPQTGLIIAHAAPRGYGKAVLGATYDHRLLSGFEVGHVLQNLCQRPPSV